MTRILLVEDSLSMRSYVRTALESDAGELGEVDVIEATGGFEALRLLPRGPYDLVITDVNMPDINGLEIVQFIRKSEQHHAVPVLLISTQASDRDRERGISLGANRYLAKPFTPEALRVAAAQEIARARQQSRSDG